MRGCAERVWSLSSSVQIYISRVSLANEWDIGFEREKINFIYPSNHVLFCCINLLITMFLTIFRRFPTIFRRFRKIKIRCSTWHEHGTKKNSESPTGIEPMASQIPAGRSNQLSYERLVESLGHLLGWCVTRVLHTARISNVEIIKCVVNNKDGKFQARW